MKMKRPSQAFHPIFIQSPVPDPARKLSEIPNPVHGAQTHLRMLFALFYAHSRTSLHHFEMHVKR